MDLWDEISVNDSPSRIASVDHFLSSHDVEVQETCVIGEGHEALPRPRKLRIGWYWSRLWGNRHVMISE